MYLESNIMEHQLKRIAAALELVIQLVKKDQEETRARFEERWDEPKNDLPDNINGRPYKGRL